jgi:hypothetical protein
MSIIVKELFSSDPISEAIEKINFNFDQIVLGGGGPPGLPGPAGPAGPVGTIGPRGDHWFIGSTWGGLTADHDGVNALRVQDNFLDPNGNIWNYFDDGIGNTGWTFSGINIKGPTGDQGAGGGSDDLKIHLGVSGNSISPGNEHYGPDPNPTDTDTDGLNFLVIRGATKNTLLLGDPEWFYAHLRNWNNVGQASGTAEPYVESTPRLMVMQRQVDFFGVNGIQIGAYGLLGTTSTNSGALINPTPLPLTENVDAIDFMNIGLSVSGSYNREITTEGVQYFSHAASIKTLKRDITIEAGDDAAGTEYAPANFRMKSANFVSQDFGGFRWISSGILRNSTINRRDHVIQINALSEGNLSTTPVQSYLHLQGASAAGNFNGPVIIGPINPTYPINRQIASNVPQPSIIISRHVPSITGTPHASIAFHNPDSGSNTFIGTITAFQDNTKPNSVKRSLIVKTGSLSITRDNSQFLWDTSTYTNAGKFPLHVNQGSSTTDNTNILETGWPTSPTGWSSELQFTAASHPIGASFMGWLSGFDKWDYKSPARDNARGIGIGYIPTARSISTYSYEPIIQSYFVAPPILNNSQAVTGLTGGGIDSLDSGVINIPIDWNINRDIGFQNFQSGMTSVSRSAPHIYMQLGEEKSSGSLAIGLTPRSSIPNGLVFPWAKLSVAGSIRVGSTGVFTYDFDNSIAKNGILSEGRIVCGVTKDSAVYSYSSQQFTDSFRGLGIFSTSLLGDYQMLTHFSPQSVTIGRNLSTQFIAGEGGRIGANAKTSYALSDAFTGMIQGATPGEGYLVSLNVRKTQQLNKSTGAAYRRGIVSSNGLATATPVGLSNTWTNLANVQPSDAASIVPDGLTGGASTVAALKWGNRSDLRELNPTWVARTAQSNDSSAKVLPVVKTLGVRADSVKYVTTQDLHANAYEVKGYHGLDNSGNEVTGASDDIRVNASWLTWKYIAHPIPTDSSTVFLDLSLPATIRKIWNAPAPNSRLAYITDLVDDTGDTYFLNTPTSNGYIPGVNWRYFKEWMLTRRFILEPGVHDGQKVTLIFGNVDVLNEFPIFETYLPPSTGYLGDMQDTDVGASRARSQAFAPKRAILAQCPQTDINSMNKYSVGATYGQGSFSSSPFEQQPAINQFGLTKSDFYPHESEPNWKGSTWPFPVGASSKTFLNPNNNSFNFFPSPDQKYNQRYLASLPDTAIWKNSAADLTTPAVFGPGDFDPSGQTYFDTIFGERDNAKEFLYWASGGGFVAKSWRTITLQWIRVRPLDHSGVSDAFIGQRNDITRAYAWVEIGREYLSTQFHSSIQAQAQVASLPQSLIGAQYMAKFGPWAQSVQSAPTTMVLYPSRGLDNTGDVGRITGRGLPIPQHRPLRFS